MDINVSLLGNHSRTLRTAVVTGHPPGNNPGHHGPIRAGTADLIVVLVKGEEHRANPEAFGTSDTGSFAWIPDSRPLSR
jgi:hypothetical protein